MRHIIKCGNSMPYQVKTKVQAEFFRVSIRNMDSQETIKNPHRPDRKWEQLTTMLGVSPSDTAVVYKFVSNNKKYFYTSIK